MTTTELNESCGKNQSTAYLAVTQRELKREILTKIISHNKNSIGNCVSVSYAIQVLTPSLF